MLGPWDLKGVFAITPTPSKEGAERPDATDTVDLDETARLTDQLIRDGVAGILVLGTTGECATLTREDYESFVDCFLGTVNKRVPTFVGATTLGTQETVRRLRFARERGADGTMLGMPMWQPCTLPMAVEYYASISEVLPDLAIMVYANSRAFRFDFPPAFWGEVARKAPTVISAKFGNAETYLACLEASNKRINFLANEGAVFRFAELSPDSVTACWSTSASMGPQPALALMEAIMVRDWERARAINDDLRWAGEPIRPMLSSFEVFASHNIQFEKIRFDAAGYCKAGPIRPPYNVIAPDLAEASRENGRRWAQLQNKYAAARVPAAGGD